MKISLIFLLYVLSACSQPQTGTVDGNSNVARQPDASANQPAAAQPPLPAITPTPELNVAFGKGLRVFPKELKAENQKLRYEIDVTYPQIKGTKNSGIINLNQRIKRLVIDTYSWSLHPSKEDIRYFDKHPGVLNTVDLTYEVPLYITKINK